MDCRTTLAHNFRKRLRFKQYVVILTREKWVLAKTMSWFGGENMQTQYNVLDYRIVLYFRDYKVATEIDENGRSDRSIDNEIKKTKSNRTRT